MRFTSAMIFHGLADYSVNEVIELYCSEQEAEANLSEILRDEPGWAGTLEVVEVEFGSVSEN
jgi:hypothetical protein